MANEIIDVLEILQSRLGSGRETCSEYDQPLWDRIETIKASQSGRDNPSNLPTSLGETVEDALRTALQTRGYRHDGDTLALARRCHFMALEDRDLLGMQQALMDLRAKKAAPATAAPKEMRLCESERITPRPGVAYVFTVDENCPRCVALAKPYRDQDAAGGPQA